MITGILVSSYFLISIILCLISTYRIEKYEKINEIEKTKTDHVDEAMIILICILWGPIALIFLFILLIVLIVDKVKNFKEN